MINRTTWSFKEGLLNAKIERFIEWLPIATIEEGWNDYQDYFEIEDEDYGFQIVTFYYDEQVDDFEFYINEEEYILTKSQYKRILNKIK